ncbi:hypothetical protein M501DRAFT_1015602 [Patellaria atrata CBS 101060]|uniref:Uncharacterized protein n=1 Tax=Patellaria atrata CBS 101060 TaxID=1346257 RepID=A0A9P4VS46_9PEZI|nr:hypothetical protein M501DRAFT_1015602 [Patellaria atrata CBS 101060]
MPIIIRRKNEKDKPNDLLCYRTTQQVDRPPIYQSTLSTPIRPTNHVAGIVYKPTSNKNVSVHRQHHHNEKPSPANPPKAPNLSQTQRDQTRVTPKLPLSPPLTTETESRMPARPQPKAAADIDGNPQPTLHR